MQGVLLANSVIVSNSTNENVCSSDSFVLYKKRFDRGGTNKEGEGHPIRKPHG